MKQKSHHFSTQLMSLIWYIELNWLYLVWLVMHWTTCWAWFLSSIVKHKILITWIISKTYVAIRNFHFLTLWLYENKTNFWRDVRNMTRESLNLSLWNKNWINQKIPRVVNPQNLPGQSDQLPGQSGDPSLLLWVLGQLSAEQISENFIQRQLWILEKSWSIDNWHLNFGWHSLESRIQKCLHKSHPLRS